MTEFFSIQDRGNGFSWKFQSLGWTSRSFETEFEWDEGVYTISFCSLRMDTMRSPIFSPRSDPWGIFMTTHMLLSFNNRIPHFSPSLRVMETEVTSGIPGLIQVWDLLSFFSIVELSPVCDLCSIYYMNNVRSTDVLEPIQMKINQRLWFNSNYLKKNNWMVNKDTTHYVPSG